jgi:hypothetical protein
MPYKCNADRIAWRVKNSHRQREYQRLHRLRHGRRCLKCGEFKGPESFVIRRGENGSEYDLESWCRKCRVGSRRGYKPAKEARRETLLKSKYGMSVEQFETLLKKQKNRCPICLREFGEKLKPFVDHCHNASHIRGLLCTMCNSAEGYIQTVDNARRLLRYMEANEIFYGNGAETKSS